MIGILQVLVSLIFFANKVFVLAGKRVGWYLGAIAATLAVFYFRLIGLNIYVVLQLGLIVLMLYGSFQKKNPKVELGIRLVTGVVMTVLAVSAFSGLLTVIELVSSLGMLIGTFYLASSNPRLGWTICIVGHLTAAYLGFDKGQQLFADFQIASAIVSLVGATLKK